MKNLILIGLLLATINSFGQQTISANNLSFKLPANLTGLKKSMSNTALSESQRKVLEIANTVSSFPKNYLGDGIVKYFSYRDTVFNARADYLLNLQKTFNEMANTSNGKKLEGFSATNQSTNSYDLLLIKNRLATSYNMFGIISVNKAKNKLFNATIIVSSKDSVAGAKAVEDLISSIHFK